MTVSATSDAYKIQCCLLTLAGIWPKKNPNIFYKIKTLISWCFAFGLYAILLVQSIYNITDILKLSQTFYILIGYAGYTVKLLAFRYYQEKFLHLIDYLNDPIFTSYAENLDLHMAKTIRQSVLLAKTLRFGVIYVMILLAVYPILDNTSTPFALPFSFGRFTTIIYILQMIGETCSAMNHIALDLTCTSLMSIASAQLNILAKEIILLKENDIAPQDHIVLDELSANGIKKLKQCINHHLAIIKLVDNIEDIFSIGILSQFATSGLGLCNTIFVFVMLPISTQQIMLGNYFFWMLVQLFMYCWYGNEIVEKSLQIGEACYMSKWYDSDCKTRKYLFLIMERSKRPLKTTAMKLSVLSLPSFVTVLRWTYSCVTLLLNMYSKKSTK